MDSLADYLEDHFPFREEFINIRLNAMKMMGFKKINGVYIGNTLIEEYKEAINKDLLIDILNKFNNKINNKGTLFLAPTSIHYNAHLLPNYINNNQITDIKYIVDKINLSNIDLTKMEGGNLYYKYDHHWSPEGAYQAYLEFCKQRNITPIKNLEKIILSDNFKGTIYSKILDRKIIGEDFYYYNINPNVDVYYKNTNKKTNSLYNYEKLKEKDKYSYFLDGNHPIIEITNNDLSEGSIVIIKDSYANSLIPFLVNHYKKIHVIDPRFYKGSISSYINEKNIDEVLFIYNMNTIDSDSGIFSIN